MLNCVIIEGVGGLVIIMSWLVACNLFFSITYHLVRTALHSSAEPSPSEVVGTAIYHVNETGNSTWSPLSITVMKRSNRYSQHKQPGGKFTVV